MKCSQWLDVLPSWQKKLNWRFQKNRMLQKRSPSCFCLFLHLRSQLFIYKVSSVDLQYSAGTFNILIHPFNDFFLNFKQNWLNKVLYYSQSCILGLKEDHKGIQLLKNDCCWQIIMFVLKVTAKLNKLWA